VPGGRPELRFVAAAQDGGANHLDRGEVDVVRHPRFALLERIDLGSNLVGYRVVEVRRRRSNIKQDFSAVRPVGFSEDPKRRRRDP
jgi:hypothetical protein